MEEAGELQPTSPQDGHPPARALSLLAPPTPLGPPSRNYIIASQSGTYRLSELMFGSLLATYALGFIGGATAENRYALPLPVEGLIRDLYHEIGRSLADNSFLLPILRLVAHSLDYLLVSLTFSGLTAALYLAYHSGMLTMPQIPQRRLRWDFAVALSQALCFGLAMLSPVLFPLCLGVAIGLAIWRQRYEVKQLVKHIRLFLGPTPAIRGQKPTDVDAARYGETRRIMRSAEVFKRENIKALAVWQQSAWYVWLFVALLVSWGILVLFLSPASSKVRIISGIVALLAGLAVVIVSGKILKGRGKPLILEPEETSMMDELDRASDALWNELKQQP